MRTFLIRKSSRMVFSRMAFLRALSGLATRAPPGARDDRFSATTSRANGRLVTPARMHRATAASQRAVNPPSIANPAPVTNADSRLSR